MSTILQWFVHTFIYSFFFFLCLSSRAPVCMVCYCQRKITSADLLVQMVQPRILKRYIFKIFYRELFRVYLENISSAGNKNIRARWYQTSKYCISAFCSFSFHSGTVEVPLQWIFVIFLNHLGLRFFLLMGIFGALIFLPMVLFMILWYTENTSCCRWCWQDVHAPLVRFTEAVN